MARLLEAISAPLAMLALWLRTAGFRRQEERLPRIMGGAVHNMLSTMQLVPAIVPVDLAGGANDGDWVSLAQYETVIFVVMTAVGTAGDDATITLNQATSAAGAGSKALAVIDEIYQKQAADIATIGQYTQVTQAAAETYVDAAGAEAQQLIAIEVPRNLLDVNNGFEYVQLAIADVGANAQLGAALYILTNPRNIKRPDELASAIV